MKAARGVEINDCVLVNDGQGEYVASVVIKVTNTEATGLLSAMIMSGRLIVNEVQTWFALILNRRYANCENILSHFMCSSLFFSSRHEIIQCLRVCLICDMCQGAHLHAVPSDVEL